MDGNRVDVEYLEKYRAFISDEAEKSIKNLFTLLNSDINQDNLNNLSTNNSTTKCAATKSLSFSNFEYSESAKRLKSALKIDPNSGKKVESVVCGRDIQEENKTTGNSVLKTDEKDIKINYYDEILKLYEFEKERSNIYVKENQLLKKQNHVLLEKLGDVINENEGLMDFKVLYNNQAGKGSENTSNVAFELDHLKQMYESKVKSLQTQLEFMRYEKIKLDHENKDLKERMTLLGIQKGTKSEFLKSDDVPDIKSKLLEQIQSLQSKLGHLQMSENNLMDEIQQKNKALEDARLEMTSAYIERDRSNEDLATSQRRWEGQLNNLAQEVSNHCQDECRLATKKLMSIQEMNKELISKVTNLEKALERSEEERRIIADETYELKQEYLNSNLKVNMLEDSKKLGEIRATCNEDNKRQQIQTLKAEISQCEQERHAERLQLKKEIDALNKRLFESERSLLQCREVVVRMQGIKQKLEIQVDALEQSKISLEKKLHNSIKNSEDGMTQQELQFNDFMISIREQHEAKLCKLEKNLETYKNLSDNLGQELKVLISQFEETVQHHKFEMKKAKEENRTLKQHFITSLEIEGIQNIAY